jgi:hypothetical protein
MKLRLVVRGRSGVLVRRFATVRIRPLPIVIPAGKVLSVPPVSEGAGWIRFALPRAAGASRCPRVATGPTVYKNNFVAVGYNARTSPHGFLGQIQRIQCKGRTGRILASYVGLAYAVDDGSLDLARFVQKGGLSSPTSAQKSFSYTFDDVPCSLGAPGTLSGSVDLSVIPRLTMQFAHDADNHVSSAAFTVTGSANVAVAVDAKAGAFCTVPLGGLPGNNSIATLEGQVGPFPVVVDLFGGVVVVPAIRAGADASAAIKATGHLEGGVGGARVIEGSSFSVANTGPTVMGNAGGSVRVISQIAVGLYGQTGAAALDVDVGLRLHADTTADPWWDFSARVSVDAGLPSFGNSSPILVTQSIYGNLFSFASASGPFPGPMGSVSITNPGDQTGVVGTPTSLQISASDTEGSPVVYEATLPPGLTIDHHTGLISGTPGISGSFTPTIMVLGATGLDATARFTWTISPASRNLVAPTRVVAGR